MVNKIIVVGYPKSGNTWITRLTAELVDCPVEGFLYEDYEEMAIEGSDRQSDFRVYKSHHQYHELKDKDQKNAKIIYVLRDPRDITLSGRQYFKHKFIKPIEVNSKNLGIRAINFLINRWNRLIRNTNWGQEKLREMMNTAVLFGNAQLHHWCRISWKKHMTPYTQNEDVLTLKYENCLDHPIDNSKNILSFLGLKRDYYEIKKAVEKQSFDKKKKEFLEQDQKEKFIFLRSGRSEQWRNEMTEEEKELFLSRYKNELKMLGYSLG